MYSIYKNRNIVISYAHIKNEFINTLQTSEYSNFRLYSLRKGNIMIRYKHQLDDTKSFLYTNYPYPYSKNNKVESGEKEFSYYDSNKFIRYQFILKNVTLLVFIHEITKEEKVVLPYTFLQLPIEIKRLPATDEDKEILNGGYTYVKLDNTPYHEMDSRRYYKIFKIYQRNFKTLKTLISGKSLRLDIYSLSSKSFLCKLIDTRIKEKEKSLNESDSKTKFDKNKSTIIERRLIFFK